MGAGVGGGGSGRRFDTAACLQCLQIFDVIIAKEAGVGLLVVLEAHKLSSGIFEDQIGAAVTGGVEQLEFVRVFLVSTVQVTHLL